MDELAELSQLSLLAAQTLGPWLVLLLQALVATLGALIVHRAGATPLERIAALHTISRRLVEGAREPARALLVTLALQIVFRAASDDVAGIELARHASTLLMLGAITWLAIAAVASVADGIVDMHPVDMADNLNARRIHTQAQFVARAIMGLIGVLGMSAVLMTFPAVRQFGASLLASAGLAGLVVGFAARPVLGNLLAGMQIALTQPIRLDDVVIMEGEWGWIEEITGTYVVVRLWDERRLIVPLQWIIERPFQNWTRKTSRIIGSVFIWVDYALPLEPLRAEAINICRQAIEWDGRVCNVQVTETSERAMQVRILVSAIDSPRCWDLRCKVREALIQYVQRNHPHCLPRLRTEPLQGWSAPHPGASELDLPPR